MKSVTEGRRNDTTMGDTRKVKIPNIEPILYSYIFSTKSQLKAAGVTYKESVLKRHDLWGNT